MHAYMQVYMQRHFEHALKRNTLFARCAGLRGTVHTMYSVANVLCSTEWQMCSVAPICSATVCFHSGLIAQFEGSALACALEQRQLSEVSAMLLAGYRVYNSQDHLK